MMAANCDMPSTNEGLADVFATFSPIQMENFLHNYEFTLKPSSKPRGQPYLVDVSPMMFNILVSNLVLYS